MKDLHFYYNTGRYIDIPRNSKYTKSIEILGILSQDMRRLQQTVDVVGSMHKKAVVRRVVSRYEREHV